MTKVPHDEETERLRRAMARLPPIEHDVLLLSARDGLGPAAIAARLGLPVEAVTGHLADALYRLDGELRRLERPWWRFW